MKTDNQNLLHELRHEKGGEIPKENSPKSTRHSRTPGKIGKGMRPASIPHAGPIDPHAGPLDPNFLMKIRNIEK